MPVHSSDGLKDESMKTPRSFADSNISTDFSSANVRGAVDSRPMGRIKRKVLFHRPIPSCAIQILNVCYDKITTPAMKIHVDFGFPYKTFWALTLFGLVSPVCRRGFSIFLHGRCRVIFSKVGSMELFKHITVGSDLPLPKHTAQE